MQPDTVLMNTEYNFSLTSSACTLASSLTMWCACILHEHVLTNCYYSCSTYYPLLTIYCKVYVHSTNLLKGSDLSSQFYLIAGSSVNSAYASSKHEAHHMRQR
jgi:hypothetical protein